MTEESHRYLSAFAYFAFRSYLEMEQTRGGVKLEFVQNSFDSIRKFDSKGQKIFETFYET